MNGKRMGPSDMPLPVRDARLRKVRRPHASLPDGPQTPFPAGTMRLSETVRDPAARVPAFVVFRLAGLSERSFSEPCGRRRAH